MSDTTSAKIFGKIFEVLASTPNTDERSVFAQKIWRLVRDDIYDFKPYQMYADKSLVELGLAWYSEGVERFIVYAK